MNTLRVAICHLQSHHPPYPGVCETGSRPGCGKTAFAKALAQHLSAEHIELDALYWSANWTPSPPEQFVEAVRQAAGTERWVADGNYGPVRDLLWSRATHIVWLHFSRTVVFSRVLWRTLKRGVTREPLWHGNRESLAKAFLSRDSILLWALGTYSKNARTYTEFRSQAAFSHLEWSVFTKPAEAKRFLALYAPATAQHVAQSDLQRLAAAGAPLSCPPRPAVFGRLAASSGSMKSDAIIRPIEPDDSLDELTALLRQAYAALGRMGLNYTAVDQSTATTAERIAEGQCFVAVEASKLVGTITVTPPSSESACEHYRRVEVAIVSQFAVAPERQSQGLGSRLLGHAESWARSQRYGAVAIDTAEPAKHLVSFYARRGYIHVGWVQWDGKRYRSVVMSKELRAVYP